MSTKTVDDVRAFWEQNPLFTGESDHPAGSEAFFEEHRRVYVEDCFAGRLDDRLFPEGACRERVLDLGCGPGFWVIEMSRRGAKQITAADLTEQALSLTRHRAAIYGVAVETSLENAEGTSFEDGQFTHVNCQGVIHHTPDTQACVREIARVLAPGGTALISVYYRNAILRAWPVLRHGGRLLAWLGARMKGRGRESIYTTRDTDEIVRLYDGEANPIGKAYTRRGFEAILSPHLEIEAVFYHFFPARTLPVRIPVWLHRWLDRRMAFMIYAKCRKPG